MNARRIYAGLCLALIAALLTGVAVKVVQFSGVGRPEVATGDSRPSTSGPEVVDSSGNRTARPGDAPRLPDGSILSEPAREFLSAVQGAPPACDGMDDVMARSLAASYLSMLERGEAAGTGDLRKALIARGSPAKQALTRILQDDKLSDRTRDVLRRTCDEIP